MLVACVAGLVPGRCNQYDMGYNGIIRYMRQQGQWADDMNGVV